MPLFEIGGLSGSVTPLNFEIGIFEPLIFYFVALKAKSEVAYWLQIGCIVKNPNIIVKFRMSYQTFFFK